MANVDREQLRSASDSSRAASDRLTTQRQTLDQQSRERQTAIQTKRGELATLVENQRYESAVQQLPLLCELAALQGSNQAEVINIHFNRDTLGDLWDNRKGFDATDPKKLRGAAKKVWDYLEENGMNPSIVEHDYDEHTSDTGCRVAANW